MKHNRNEDWEARQWLRSFLGDKDVEEIELQVVDYTPDPHHRGYDPRNKETAK